MLKAKPEVRLFCWLQRFFLVEADVLAVTQKSAEVLQPYLNYRCRWERKVAVLQVEKGSAAGL